MTTYTINRGNQYDGQDGYRITSGSLRGWGRVARRMDGTVGLTCDGTLTLPVVSPHHCSQEDRDRVEQAIRDTLADGVEREVTIGTPDPQPEEASAEWRSPRGLTLSEEMDREDSIY